MAIIWTGLAPHPPIIVPEVGGTRCSEVQTTIDSMRTLARDLVAREPERLVLISPHTPRPGRGIGIWSGDEIHGDFSQFGAANAGLSLPVASAWLNTFRRHYPAVADLDQSLDHGAMVPLYFLVEAGWCGATAVMGLPWDENEEPRLLGEVLGTALEDEVPTAVLASGDMSHCLKPGAPAGYDEQGSVFDQAFVACIKQADYREAENLDPSLRERARQDVVESCRVAWHASGFADANHHFYSYEGPFGVGYTVMRFFGVD